MQRVASVSGLTLEAKLEKPVLVLVFMAGAIAGSTIATLAVIVANGHLGGEIAVIAICLLFGFSVLMVTLESVK